MQGSIFWMAPEGASSLDPVPPARSSPPLLAVIHNNKQGYSAKADIWSLGCICIEMLAGSRPWEGEGFMAAMFKVSVLVSCELHPTERSNANRSSAPSACARLSLPMSLSLPKPTNSSALVLPCMSRSSQ